MSYGMCLISVFRTLTSHKARALLLMLAIASGTTVLLLTLALRAGIEQRVSKFMDMFFHENEGAISYPNPKGQANARSVPHAVRLEDLHLLQEQLRHEASFSGELQSEESVCAEGRRLTMLITAAEPSFMAIRDWTIQEGRPLDEEDEEAMSKTCILTTRAAAFFWGKQDAIGKQITIGTSDFWVKGLREENPAVARTSPKAAGQVLIPLSTALKRLWRYDGPEVIRFKVKKPYEMAKVTSDIGWILRRKHDIKPPRPNDFEVSGGAEIVMKFKAARQPIVKAGLGLSLFAFLLGAGMIVNTMTASVVQHKTEIALKRALGASRRDVSMEILMESIIVSCGGCILGIFLSYGVLAAWHSFATQKTVQQFPAVFSLPGFLWPACLALVVGVSTGLWVARRAWPTNPGQSLRS